MQFVRLIVFGFLVLSVVYLCVSWYSRSVRREKLEKEFDAAPPAGANDAMRSAFIEKGMADYHASVRPKLIGLVYVVPLIAMSVIIYVVNSN